MNNMELIDKTALVAEIERYISNYKEIVVKTDRNDSTWVDSVSMIDAKIDVLQHLLFFLDTLEVKEVDLEKELKVLIGNIGQCDRKLAKHFFELGLTEQTPTVWHYVSTENPTKFGESIIIASKNNNEEDGIWLYDLIQSWGGEWNPRVNWETPVKWAYMDDLLNARKGE